MLFKFIYVYGCLIVVMVLWTIFSLASPRLVFCDVGEGDAFILSVGYWQLLVDTGPDESVLTCLGKTLPFYDRRLELMLLTHADSDHIGGARAVLEHYAVGTLVMPVVAAKSQIYQELLQQIIKSEIKTIQTPTTGQFWQINPQIWLELIAPLSNLSPIYLKNETKTETTLQDVFNQENQSQYSENDLSIVVFIHIYGEVIMLVGDIETKGELALLETKMTQKTKLLKVAHHGSKTSTSLEFLAATRPEIAIISCGAFNPYHHPDTQVLSRLQQIGAKVIRTDEVGDLVFGYHSGGLVQEKCYLFGRICY